jgi:MFS family permease
MENLESIGSEKSLTLLLLSISLATFMASLDSTIVNIAPPSISETFNVSTTTVSWVSISYLLVMVGCLLVFGKISDVIGYKKIFLSGFAIFTLGSSACGFLPEVVLGFPALVISRMFQAVGGAMITSPLLPQ